MGVIDVIGLIEILRSKRRGRQKEHVTATFSAFGIGAAGGAGVEERRFLVEVPEEIRATQPPVAGSYTSLAPAVAGVQPPTP